MYVDAFGVSKADWKNIEQRKIEARNGRRGKKQGAAAIGIGSAAGAAGIANGGSDVVRLISNVGNRKYKLNRKWSGGSFPDRDTHFRAAKSGTAAALGAANSLTGKQKLAGAAVAGGAALVGGGAAKYAAGLGKEKHAEHKIEQMRKKRAISKMDNAAYVSPFGVEHEDISKARTPAKSGYTKPRFQAGKYEIQTRKGSYIRRVKGRLKDQLPADAAAVATAGGQLALLKEHPKTSIGVGAAGLAATVGLQARGQNKTMNREIKNKDLLIRNKKTGKKATGVGFRGYKYD